MGSEGEVFVGIYLLHFRANFVLNAILDNLLCPEIYLMM